MLEAAGAGVAILRVAQSRELVEAFDRFAQKAVAGQISPEKSLQQAAAEMRLILDNSDSCG